MKNLSLFMSPPPVIDTAPAAPAKTSRPLQASIIILPIFLLGFLLARFAAPIFGLLPSCTFRTMFGIPCPSCGATHAGLALARGELFSALAYNPLFVIAIGILTWWSANNLLEQLRGKFPAKNFMQKFFRAIGVKPNHIKFRQPLRRLTIGALALNWLYLIFNHFVAK